MYSKLNKWCSVEPPQVWNSKWDFGSKLLDFVMPHVRLLYKINPRLYSIFFCDAKGAVCCTKLTLDYTRFIHVTY